ncbi:MAG TPA: signal peptidase II [Nocardioides sp.]
MQAARGTSLSSGSGDHESRPDSDDTPDVPAGDAPGRLPRRRAWAIFAVVALATYLLDLATKQLALTHLQEADGSRPRVDLIGDLLGLQLAFNPGAAFSLGEDFTVVISCVAIVATCVVLYFSTRLRSPLWAVGMGVLLAGITGNLTDRLFRDPAPFHGHVVDMIELPNFPIFNVADMCINIAAALIIIQSFRGIRLDGSRIEEPEKPAKAARRAQAGRAVDEPAEEADA